MTIAVTIAALSFAAGEKSGSRRFSDVPENHWAAGAVQQLSDNRVLTGYPDSTFRGDRPVTRYELAVALARFAEFIEAGRADLSSDNAKVGTTLEKTKHPEWARKSIDFLIINMFLEDDSPIITDGWKSATSEDLAQSFSSMLARIVELDVAGCEPEDEK